MIFQGYVWQSSDALNFLFSKFVQDIYEVRESIFPMHKSRTYMQMFKHKHDKFAF